MLHFPNDEIIRDSASVLAAVYPLDAERIAAALVDDHIAAGNEAEARLWDQIRLSVTLLLATRDLAKS